MKIPFLWCLESCSVTYPTFKWTFKKNEIDWSLNNRQLSILKRVALCFMLTLLTEVIKWTCICRIKYKPFLLPKYNFFVYFDRCWFGSAVIFRLYFCDFCYLVSALHIGTSGPGAAPQGQCVFLNHITLTVIRPAFIHGWLTHKGAGRGKNKQLLMKPFYFSIFFQCFSSYLHPVLPMCHIYHWLLIHVAVSFNVCQRIF